MFRWLAVAMRAKTALATGVIEGFFGKHWSWTARLDCIDFLRAWGYQFYIYAPKSEAFLRRRWRDPIPAETMRYLGQLSERCRQSRIDFGVGLTPFEAHLNYDANAKKHLRSKVLQINAVKARTLAILFDDMRGDVAELAERQARLVTDICSWSDASRFIVAPTYYSNDPRLTHVFGLAPERYLEKLGLLLDERIGLFWTGEKVISDGYSEQHLISVAAVMGRKPFIWDNHIANDAEARTNFLFLDPCSGPWNLATESAAGLAINPMNQPYLSRLPLGGYRRLLMGRDRENALQEICQELCGASFTRRLLTDLNLLQTTGLSRLDENTRASLLERYAADHGNRYAQEIASWLRGDYAFDPQCLTS